MGCLGNEKMNIYTDNKKHKSGSFFNRKERDAEVKLLREQGWMVKVGKYGDVDGSGEIYWYEAIKED